MPAPTQARAQRTRGEILAAAEGHFARHGFAQTRLADVGADAGVGRSVVLYHFGDKRALYRTVLDEVFAPLLSTLRRALAGSGSLLERLENAVGELVDYVACRPAAARIALLEAATPDPELRREIQSRAAPFLELFAMVLEEGVRAKEIDPIGSNPFHFLSAIGGAIIFYVAALPTFVADLPDDHLAPEHVQALKRDVLAIARRLLGTGAPRAVVPINSAGQRPSS